MLLAKEAQAVDTQDKNSNWRKWAGRLLLILLFILNSLLFGIGVTIFIILNITIIIIALNLMSEEVY